MGPKNAVDGREDIHTIVSAQKKAEGCNNPNPKVASSAIERAEPATNKAQ